MLTGQQLSGRHERRLPSRLRAQQHRAHGHGGLAAPHVALHHARHGMRGGQIAGDFPKRAPLRAGGRKRHGFPESLRRARRRRQAGAWAASVAHQSHRSLIQEHVLKGKTPLRLCGLLQGGRLMSGAQGAGARPQAKALKQALRQRFGACLLRGFQRLAHGRLVQPLRHARYRPVDGHHAELLFQGRIRHPLARAASLHPAIQHEARAGVKMLAHPGLVEPAGGNLTRFIGKGAGHAAELAVTRQLRLAAAAEQQADGLTRLRLPDGGGAAQVPVTHGKGV